MAGAVSNISGLAAALVRRRGNLDGGLGARLLDIASEGMRRRTLVRQVDVDGAPLRPLTAPYLRAKAREGRPATIGVATGDMLSEDAFRGTRSGAGAEMTLAYGANEGQRRKAEHFEAAGRRFWGLDDAIRGEIAAAIRAGGKDG